MFSSFIGLFILIFLIALSFRKSRFSDATLETAWPGLDFEASVQLKGLAILLVIFSHLNVVGFVGLPPALKFSGAWGVAIFLLLSGFGLAQSYQKRGLGPEYLYKRLTKVLLPYILVTAGWLVLDIALFGANYSFKTAALALVALDFSSAVDPTMWFITFIVLWYALFYLVFKLPVKNAYKVVLLFVLAYFLKNYSAPVVGSRTAWQWGLHAYLFPIGALAGLYWQALNERASRFVKPQWFAMGFAGIAILSLVPFFFFVFDSLNNLRSYSNANFAFAVFSIGLIVFLRFVGLESRMLLALGSFSFELYLLEWALMDKYRLLFIFESKALSLAIYALALALGAFFLKQLTDHLARLLGVSRYAPPAIKELPIVNPLHFGKRAKTDQIVENNRPIGRKKLTNRSKL